jgi:hypothetical protein
MFIILACVVVFIIVKRIRRRPTKAEIASGIEKVVVGAGAEFLFLYSGSVKVMKGGSPIAIFWNSDIEGLRAKAVLRLVDQCYAAMRALHAKALELHLPHVTFQGIQGSKFVGMERDLTGSSDDIRYTVIYPDWYGVLGSQTALERRASSLQSLGLCASCGFENSVRYETCGSCSAPRSAPIYYCDRRDPTFSQGATYQFSELPKMLVDWSRIEAEGRANVAAWESPDSEAAWLTQEWEKAVSREEEAEQAEEEAEQDQLWLERKQRRQQLWRQHQGRY